MQTAPALRIEAAKESTMRAIARYQANDELQDSIRSQMASSEVALESVDCRLTKLINAEDPDMRRVNLLSESKSYRGISIMASSAGCHLHAMPDTVTGANAPCQAPVKNVRVATRIPIGLAVCIATLLTAAPTIAQTKIHLPSQTRNVDFGSAPSTRPNQVGESLPETCKVGDTYFRTIEPAGLYGCIAPDTWKAVGTGAALAGEGIGIINDTIIVDRTTTPQFLVDIVDAHGMCSTGTRWIRTDSGEEWVCSAPDTWTKLAKLDSNNRITAAMLPALAGDVASQPGSATATVVGLQGRAMSSTVPSDGQAIVWNSMENTWKPAAGGVASDAMDMTNKTITESFCSGDTVSGRIGGLGWSLVSLGTAGTVVGGASEQAYPCQLRITTGAAVDSGYYLNTFGVSQMQSAMLQNTAVGWEMAWMIVPGANTTSISGARIRLGISNSSSGMSHAWFWRYDTALGDTTWKFVECRYATACDDAGSGTDVTVTASTIAPTAGARALLRMRKASGSSTLYVRVNGEDEIAIPAVTPPSTTIVMGPFAWFTTNSSTSTAFSLGLLDWRMKFTGLLPY